AQGRVGFQLSASLADKCEREAVELDRGGAGSPTVERQLVDLILELHRGARPLVGARRAAIPDAPSLEAAGAAPDPPDPGPGPPRPRGGGAALWGLCLRAGGGASRRAPAPCSSSEAAPPAPPPATSTQSRSSTSGLAGSATSRRFKAASIVAMFSGKSRTVIV